MMHYECSKQISKNELIHITMDFFTKLFKHFENKTLTIKEISKKRFIFTYEDMEIEAGIAGYIDNQPVIVIADKLNFNKIFNKIQLEYGLKKKFSVIFTNYIKDIFCEKFFSIGLRFLRMAR